ncbi:MAG: ribosomal-processing cysteine protease Prp [Brochothrix sp.]|uniref:ribosomal-processing cysteine protease Prp n=1 Tax=Brochothrix sp. TaxID=1993875 RepID=UPI0025797C46|nr:ribosomal-processing cysteine protease Prp [Brochothrix sp.]MBR5526724.1 ribosomal-processing cysteine protease Prp [Brochothrix sp.]
MIKVNVNRLKESKEIVAIEMTGHADYAESGKDLVCAGASTVIFGMINAISLHIDQLPHIEEEDDGGYLYYSLPVDLSDEAHRDVQLLAEALLTQFTTLEASYAEFIQIKNSWR